MQAPDVPTDAARWRATRIAAHLTIHRAHEWHAAVLAALGMADRFVSRP